MIHLDTSILIAAFTGPKTLSAELDARIAQRERISISAIALYEWWRGPRTAAELEMQHFLVPAWEAIEFGTDEAQIAAELYQAVSRPRRREIDLAIAACAITNDARLWTLTPGDFSDVPGLRLLGHLRDDDSA